MTRKCSLCGQEGHQRSHCANSPFGGAFDHSIKSVDDTPVTESRSEEDAVYRWLTNLEARIVELEKELALVLEQRVTARDPADTDDDPEWY